MHRVDHGQGATEPASLDDAGDVVLRADRVARPDRGDDPRALVHHGAKAIQSSVQVAVVDGDLAHHDAAVLKR